jgi:hypothetical protein
LVCAGQRAFEKSAKTVSLITAASKNDKVGNGGHSGIWRFSIYLATRVSQPVNLGNKGPMITIGAGAGRRERARRDDISRWPPDTAW